MYERTVAAATAETTSKFRLAEALALDIPYHPSGRAAGKTVPEQLAEAAKAIVAAGGEVRAIDTLNAYRITALWVYSERDRKFAWVPGYSFGAHREANNTGMSYADFVARPRTVDETRREYGRTGASADVASVRRVLSDPERARKMIGDLPTETQAAIARQVLADPEVAQRTFSAPLAAPWVNDPQAGARIRAQVFQSMRENQSRPQPSPRPEFEPEPQPADGAGILDILNELAEARRRVRAAFKRAVAFGPDAGAKNEILSELADVKAEIDPFEAFLTGMGLDEAIEQMLKGA